MDDIDSTSYLCLCKSTDTKNYTKDQLNGINIDFMKACKQVNKHCKFEPFYFGNFIHHVRNENWTEAEKHQKQALTECEVIIEYLKRYKLYRPNESNQTGESRPGSQSMHDQYPDFMDDVDRFSVSGHTTENKPPSTSYKSAVEGYPGYGHEEREDESKKERNKTERNSNKKEAAKQIDDAKTDLKKNGNLHNPEPSNTHPSTGRHKLNQSEVKSGTKEFNGVTVQKRNADSKRDTNTRDNNTSNSETKKTSIQGLSDSDELIQRSEKAAFLLLEGNPNIADLSDSNRPTKLGERFSELYSNEYTDAFEELHKELSSERDIINVLLDIVKNACVFCQRKYDAESRRLMFEAEENLKKQGDMTERVETISKVYVARQLKQSGIQNSEIICKEFMETQIQTLFRGSGDPHKTKLYVYAERCVEIVWFMCIQDPPLCMKWIETKDTGKEFNTDLYRFYTKSGQRVDYCVWPLLLLYDRGPILRKGIAQGK